ncbi:MAG: DUF4399 domain-containing protein [Pseudomonadota bacterium]
MKSLLGIATVATFGLGVAANADGHLAWEATEGAYVYFINLEDGDTVSGPVLVQMGLSGMGVAPAGTDREGTGHHHLLVNRAPMGEGPDGEEEWQFGLLADENHIHYGAGQTEAMLDLPAGTHTIQMVFGDAGHVPFGPQMVSEQITITVE